MQFISHRLFFLRRLKDALEKQTDRMPWASKLLAVVDKVSFPLLAYLLGQLTVEIFQELAWQQTLLAGAIPLILIWFFYRLLDTLLKINLPSEQARLWNRKVLLPIAILVGALQSVGLLDNILQWGLSFRGDVRVTVGSLILSLAIIVLFFVASRSVRRYLQQVFFPQANLSPALNQALSTLTAYGVIIIGTVVALNMMGVDLTLLAVVAGGLSVGLGFGLQEVVSNFVSGFILMFEQSIGPGDVIEVGDDVGIVQTIGVRSTIIRNRDNVELIIPNSRLLSETVTNLTRSDQQVRIRISVGVTYSADPQAVKQALLEAVQHPFVSEQPAPSIQFRDFGDSSLTFDLLVWTDKAFQSLNLASDLRYQIWDALKAHNIEIPFPQRDIHIRSGVPWQELIQNGQHMSF